MFNQVHNIIIDYFLNINFSFGLFTKLLYSTMVWLPPNRILSVILLSFYYILLKDQNLKKKILLFYAQEQNIISWSCKIF